MVICNCDNVEVCLCSISSLGCIIADTMTKTNKLCNQLSRSSWISAMSRLLLSSFLHARICNIYVMGYGSDLPFTMKLNITSEGYFYSTTRKSAAFVSFPFWLLILSINYLSCAQWCPTYNNWFITVTGPRVPEGEGITSLQGSISRI